jgi:hypothetical protein
MPELHTLMYANLIMPDVCTLYPLMRCMNYSFTVHFARSHKTAEMVFACKLSRIVKIFHSGKVSPLHQYLFGVYTKC